MNAVNDVLDLDIHALAIEVWPDVERVVQMWFPEGAEVEDSWTLTVPHPTAGDDYEIEGVLADAGDPSRPRVTFTLPADRMRDVLRQQFIITYQGVPKLSGPMRLASPQSAAGETTVTVTLVEPQALEVELVVVGGSGGSGGGTTVHGDLTGRNEPDQHTTDAITVPAATMPFVEAYYPTASDDLTDNLNAIDDAFVGAATAIVDVGAASVSNAQKGAPNGVAELDGSGLVLASQLPSYVDDVIVVANYAALPGTGADGKIYVTTDTNLTYRWNGVAYTEISPSLALGTTSSTAYRGDWGAQTAAGLADLSGVTDAAAARGNLGLGSIATKSAIYRSDIATGAIDAALLDPDVQADIDGAYARANHTGTQAQSTITNLTSDLAAKAPTSRTITAGNGLAGGGDLSADRTLALTDTVQGLVGEAAVASAIATRTATTVLIDDVLQLPVVAGAVYAIDSYMELQGDSTADCKVGVSMPTGTMGVTAQHPLNDIASAQGYDRFTGLSSTGTTALVGIAGATTRIRVTLTGVIRPTADGVVGVAWAPNAAGAGSGVTRLTESYLILRRLA